MFPPYVIHENSKEMAWYIHYNKQMISNAIKHFFYSSLTWSHKHVWNTWNPASGIIFKITMTHVQTRPSTAHTHVDTECMLKHRVDPLTQLWQKAVVKYNWPMVSLWCSFCLYWLYSTSFGSDKADLVQFSVCGDAFINDSLIKHSCWMRVKFFLIHTFT